MAQRNEKDSIMMALRNDALTDTSKVNIAIRLAKYWRNSNSDSARQYAQIALEISTRSQFLRGKGAALNLLGLVAKDKGEQEKAVQLFRQSLLAFKTLGHSYAVANGYNNLGLTYDDVLNKKAALSCYDSALILYQSLSQTLKTAETYNNFGQSYRKNGNYIAALDNYFKALKLFRENQGDSVWIKRVLGNIAVVYQKMKNYPEAISYGQQALALIPADNLYSRITTLTNLSDAYILSGDYPHAEKTLLECQQLINRFDSPESKAALLSSLGYIKIKTGKAAESIPLLEEAVTIANRLNIPEGQATTLNNLAEAWLILKNLSKSRASAVKALQVAKKHHLDDQLEIALKNLAQVAIADGDFKSGYEYINQQMQVKDSLFNEKTVKRFYEIEKEYALDKKQSEITLLANQNQIKELQLVQERNTRLFLLIGLAIALFSLTVIYLLYQSKARLNQKLAEQNTLIHSINKDLQAQALRAQMNPHFIFNSLNSIQFLISRQETSKAIDYLSKFALLLRKVMDNSEKNFIPLSDEIELLNLYLQLESLRFDGSFAYHIDVQVDNPNAHQVPPLVVQPYIENAILHGLMPKTGNRQLHIRFSQQPHLLLCEIQDNGIGRTAAMENSKRKRKLFNSKGMNYTDQRIKVMNNMFDHQSRIKVTDLVAEGKANGTLVSIAFANA
jgi:tetratricopeptide (TPR) repeat protein